MTAAGAADDRELTGPAPSSRSLVGLLSSPVRLRVVAALALGATSPSQIAGLTGFDDHQISVALTRMLRAGLVSSQGGQLHLRENQFADAARAEAPERGSEDFGAADPAVRRVLRAYLVDGRLSSIPVPGRKRRIVLEHLASAFEPGVRYREVQVNAILRAWHDDVAALRRYLVEEGLLSRAGGEYWRSGGWVDVL